MNYFSKGFKVMVEPDFDGPLDQEPWVSSPFDSFLVALMVAHECVELYPTARVTVGDLTYGRVVFDSLEDKLFRKPKKGTYQIIHKGGKPRLPHGLDLNDGPEDGI